MASFALVVVEQLAHPSYYTMLVYLPPMAKESNHRLGPSTTPHHIIPFLYLRWDDY